MASAQSKTWTVSPGRGYGSVCVCAFFMQKELARNDPLVMEGPSEGKADPCRKGPPSLLYYSFQTNKV